MHVVFDRYSLKVASTVVSLCHCAATNACASKTDLVCVSGCCALFLWPAEEGPACSSAAAAGPQQQQCISCPCVWPAGGTRSNSADRANSSRSRISQCDVGQGRLGWCNMCCGFGRVEGLEEWLWRGYMSGMSGA